MVVQKGRHGEGGDRHFVELPWDEQTPQWQEIDLSLPAGDLARQIAQAIEVLDLAGLFATYGGRGSKALRPDLLLKCVLYEMQRGQRSPAQWYRDAKENDPVKWLLFGMRPSAPHGMSFGAVLRSSGIAGMCKCCGRPRSWGSPWENGWPWMAA